MLDIQKLLASGDDPACDIDTLDEVTAGGAESDCPAVASILNAPGGPHWGALDNLKLGEDGKYHETTGPPGWRTRTTSSPAPASTATIASAWPTSARVRSSSLDESFRDERTGTPCIDFDRDSWPHGDWGPAKPHSLLFVAADDDVADGE